MFILPTSLLIGDKEYSIRTDYRDVLTILKVFNDPELTDEEKSQLLLIILFPDCEEIPLKDVQEAYEKALEFIDAGLPESSGSSEPLVYWEQDSPLIFAAINKNLRTEIRSVDYMHWWTFLGYFWEIGESLFSNVVSIRQKKAKHKKLETHEREFERENANLIKRQVSKEERKEIEKEKKNLEQWL